MSPASLEARRPATGEPARMAPLAKLPVFLDLEGKRAVLAGGTSAAAWKAELLAAAGAHVEVYAAGISSDMARLIARGAAAGAITHHPRVWSPDVLPRAAIALADVATDEEARAFHAAAAATGVLVNVIDKPAFCQFQFGAIVNRSPVVVGISTDGAAPILGQAIRQRIEMLLPPTLADWGRLAKALRDLVSRRLAPGPQRRTFWERLAAMSFGPAPAGDARSALERFIAEVHRGVSPSRGRVTLVGAGPGDAELLTVKAVRALQSADVILYDDLVSDDVLELARREAKRMMVGKRGRRASCRQDDINALMIRLARQGRHVVRLKCGDPMIFGRAGEEIAELEAARIPVSVVPGVTAALAMASSLGVSLTHRDCAHSVRFVTGHARDGRLPDRLDWKGLADPETTLIVYMGGRTGAALARRLMDEGVAGETPCVILSGVSRAEQRRWTGHLAALGSGIAELDDGAPVLLGVGAVFAKNAAKCLATEPPMSQLA